MSNQQSLLKNLGWLPEHSGKVRDLYFSENHPELLLVVASDRISAFDRVLSPEIPGKGALLTRLSRWWFARFADVTNHMVEQQLTWLPDDLAKRAMLVKKLEMFPLEAVVRGYLTGSAWLEYRARQTVGGLPHPPGLKHADMLPEALYTPAQKMPHPDHDQNISFSQSEKLVGADVAKRIREISLDIFTRASGIAQDRGLILADTKFEFGLNTQTGAITLADELLTADSSRYWDAQNYFAHPTNRFDSFDKQPVRDWLNKNWDGSSSPPLLPEQLVKLTAARYRELLTMLGG